MQYYSDDYYSWQSRRSYQSAEVFLKVLFDIYKPKSVADFGCGQGAWLVVCEKMGASMLHGYDGEWIKKEKLYSKNIKFFSVDFESEVIPQGKYDLAISVEVAEHISDKNADAFVNMLTIASDVIVFGAAIKQQGGSNHINEQWQTYWVNKFFSNGYVCFDIFRPKLWHNNNIEWWYRQNTFLFVKKDVIYKIFKSNDLKKYEIPIYDIVHPENFKYRLVLIEELENSLTDLKKLAQEKDKAIILLKEELENSLTDLKKKEEYIEFICSSKFWKLRNFYIKIKGVNIEKIKSLIKTAVIIFRRDGFKVLIVRFIDFIRHVFFGINKRTYITIRKCNEVSNEYQKKWTYDRPLVSIIIPCYNYGKFVTDAIESAENQTFKNIEIIVINDGSTDQDTINVLNSLSYPKTRIVHQKNQGLASTRNNGAIISRGKYICYLDADDMIHPTYIEKTLFLLEERKNLGSAYSWVQCFEESNDIWKTQDLNPFMMRDANISPSHSVIKKEVWEKVRELNGVGFLTKYEGYFEDWVFWIDMIRVGFGGAVIKEPLIKYRVHKHSLSATHKHNFDVKMKELVKDRNDFFRNDIYIKKLQEKISHCVKVINPLENLSSINHYKEIKKSVLFVLPWLNCGGVESVLLSVIKGLQNVGYNIYIITTEVSNNEWNKKFDKIVPTIYHIANYIPRDILIDFFNNFIKTRKIKMICGIHSSFFYQVVKKISKDFVDIRVLDIIHNDSEAGYYKQACAMDSYINTHIAISSKICESICYEGVSKNKVSVIYNGVDTKNRFNGENIKKDSLVIRIIFMGRFSIEKRPFDFLKIALALSKRKNIKFFMAGDGPLMSDMKKYVKKNNLDKVEFLGFVEPEDILKKSDILVITSDIEGFPMAAIEAMSMKNIVVSTNVGELNKLIIDGENGYLINDVGDIKKFIQKISYLLDNHELLKKMQIMARESVKDKYTEDKMIAEYIKIFSTET